MDYSLEKFEKDMSAMQPRFFDIWILPLFMVGYAIKSRSMGKAARRLLCSGGIYMGMRNYAHYKSIVLPALQTIKKGGSDVPL